MKIIDEICILRSTKLKIDQFLRTATMNFLRGRGDKSDIGPDFMCDSVSGPNLIENTKDLYEQVH